MRYTQQSTPALYEVAVEQGGYFPLLRREWPAVRIAGSAGAPRSSTGILRARGGYIMLGRCGTPFAFRIALEERPLLSSGARVFQDLVDNVHECLKVAIEQDLGDAFWLLIRVVRGELALSKPPSTVGARKS